MAIVFIAQKKVKKKETRKKTERKEREKENNRRKRLATLLQFDDVNDDTKWIYCVCPNDGAQRNQNEWTNETRRAHYLHLLPFCLFPFLLLCFFPSVSCVATPNGSIRIACAFAHSRRIVHMPRSNKLARFSSFMWTRLRPVIRRNGLRNWV